MTIAKKAAPGRDRMRWAALLAFVVTPQAAGAGFPKSPDVRPFAGSWRVDRPPRENCQTFEMTILNLYSDRKYRMMERRRCYSRTYKLYYDVQSYCANGLRLLSAVPSKDPHFPDVQLQSGDTANYSVDKLTLWLSGDGCKLTGTRSDQYNIWEFSASRDPCPRPAPCR